MMNTTMTMRSNQVFVVEMSKITDFDKSFLNLRIYKNWWDALNYLHILHRLQLKQKTTRLMIDNDKGLLEANYYHKDLTFKIRRMDLYDGIE